MSRGDIDEQTFEDMMSNLNMYWIDNREVLCPFLHVAVVAARDYLNRLPPNGGRWGETYFSELWSILRWRAKLFERSFFLYCILHVYKQAHGGKLPDETRYRLWDEATPQTEKRAESKSVFWGRVRSQN